MIVSKLKPDYHRKDGITNLKDRSSAKANLCLKSSGIRSLRKNGEKNKIIYRLKNLIQPSILNCLVAGYFKPHKLSNLDFFFQ